jgi:hypothetical protein
VKDNPWQMLGPGSPYLLDIDAALVNGFNQGLPAHHAHFNVRTKELIPEPFVGNRNAPVLLLSNNPGVGKDFEFKQSRSFMDKMRRNLAHERLAYPFIYLDPELFGDRKTWWRSKVKQLIKAFDEPTIAKSVLNVVLFPYASRRFGHGKLASILPSQKYSFRLVSDAVKRGAAVVHLRRGKSRLRRWEEGVPELVGYDRRFVVNSQNASVSKKNCDEFEEIVRAIETSL